MQENRSFDHYYGTMSGVRGYADRAALRLDGVWDWLSGVSRPSDPDFARIVELNDLKSPSVEPGQVLVTVQDHGVGMPVEFDDQLFSRYQWSANNPTTTVMGTGFGLPMARQIVEMHGGRIWFSSKMGVGSAFHFSLPMQSNRAVPPEADLKAPRADRAA